MEKDIMNRKNIALISLLLMVNLLGGVVITAQEDLGLPREAVIREQLYNRQGVFENLDADGDGFLSMDEYNGTPQLFADMDVDGNEQLSPEEAQYMITFAEIPTGSFTMGTNTPIMAWGPSPVTDVSPAHEITIDGFKMGATEITTAQYAMFLNSALEAGEIVVQLVDGPDKPTRVSYPIPTYMVEGAPGTELAGEVFTYLSPIGTLSHLYALGNPILVPEHPMNASWIQYDPELGFHVYPGFEEWPAAFIKWWGAKGFADHYGLSLPTEYEWEYVASGGEQFEFASSDGTIGCEDANYRCYNSQGLPNFQASDTPEEFVGFRITVGTYPANPYGVYDMSGNVWEWMMGWYQADFYQYVVDNGITRNPVKLEGEDPPMEATGGPGQVFSHDARITRGGSYNYHEEVTRTAFRMPTYPFIGNDHFGIRVVIRPETTVFNGTD
jgi:formylglycine-generating enzyme